MGNAAQITLTDPANPLDIGSNVYIATFQTVRPDNNEGGTEEFTVEARIAERVVLQSGLEPSYAIITIPMDDFPNDENAFTVALARGGFGDRLRLRTRCTVSHYYQQSAATALLTGTVTDIAHDVENDACVVTVLDDRWILSRYFAFGQVQFDPTKTAQKAIGKLAFVADEECIFNRFGLPNCMDLQGQPFFAPSPRFGWKQGDTAEPTPGGAVTRARSWQASDAVEYLRNTHYSDALWPGTGVIEYGRRWLPTNTISWPMGLGGMLAAFKAGDGTDVTTDRPLHDFSIEGMDMNAALGALAKAAGPFEVYMLPYATGGGDNGNDPGAFLQNADPSGLYATFVETVRVQLEVMGNAFNNSQDTLKAAVGSMQKMMKQAFASFSAGLSSPAHPGLMKYRSGETPKMMQLIDRLNEATTSNYQDKVRPIYQEWLAEIGSDFEGNPGLFTMPDGTISATASAGGKGGETIQRMARGIEACRSTLTFVNKSNRRGGGKAFVGGIAQSDLEGSMRGNSAVSGFMRESIRHYFDEVCVLGDAPVFERTVYTAIGSGDANENGLEPAWTTVDQNYFLTYIASNGSNRKAFLEARSLWPLVFVAYRVASGYDYTAGTKWSLMGPKRARKHPRIRTTLVTGFNQNESNPSSWQPRPIIVESAATGSSSFTACSKYDNLAVSLDGSYFMLEALADDPTTHPTWQGSLSSPMAITARELRVTLAIQADFRITGYAGKSLDPNTSYARVHHDQGGMPVSTYIASSKPLDYVEWLRGPGAYPAGQQIPASYRNGQGIDTPKCANANELFTDRPTDVNGALIASGRINAHALNRQRDLKRVAGNSELIYEQFEGAFQPGLVISGITDAGVNVYGVVQTVTIEGNTDIVRVALA